MTTKNTVIHTVKARETGATITILRLGKPVGEDKYAASCEHGASTTTKTRRDARAAGRIPTSWCKTCAKGTTKVGGTKVAQTRRVSAAKK